MRTAPLRTPDAVAGPNPYGAGAKKKPADPANQKRVAIRNSVTRLCAELPGRDNGAIDGPVQESDCNFTDADNQVWDLEVQHPHGGPHSNSLFQLWWLEKQRDGHYWFHNIASHDLCLNVDGNSPPGRPVTTKSRLTLQECSDTDDREWDIIKVPKGI
ncbi:RICIN domain-containing protein [Streptomyces sp. NPDC088348]|uniref:RICIN domain-containing protein n=1 Tax=Streptomyces sp. NPDC088348 TaxID=3365853 RepID=UPI0037F2BE1E